MFQFLLRTGSFTRFEVHALPDPKFNLKGAVKHKNKSSSTKSKTVRNSRTSESDRVLDRGLIEPAVELSMEKFLSVEILASKTQRGGGTGHGKAGIYGKAPNIE